MPARRHGWHGRMERRRADFPKTARQGGPTDHQTVGPLLVEDRLQKMRQKRRGDRRQEDMVAVDAMARASLAAVEPPSCCERFHSMFVGAPGEGLGNPFDFRTGTIRYLL